jgi:hypothetical protein
MGRVKLNPAEVWLTECLFMDLSAHLTTFGSSQVFLTAKLI